MDRIALTRDAGSLRLLKTNMSSPPVTFPIRAVAKMTGVSIDTLRAWERRYGAVTPQRDDRGRVYSDADVRRVRLLHDAVERGHAIGRIAHLSDDELVRVSVAPSPARNRSATPGSPTPGPSTTLDIRPIVESLARFDATAVETELARSAALLRAPDLLTSVLVPLMTEIGQRYYDGESSIAHEHMLSACVRNVLGSLLRVHAKQGFARTLLFATLSGEPHEFGTLGAAVLAASGGLGAIYLGPDIPADDILEVTKTVRVDAVVLGLTIGARRARDEVKKLALELDPGVELWLGGRHGENMAKEVEGRALALSSYESLERQLVRIGATF